MALLLSEKRQSWRGKILEKTNLVSGNAISQIEKVLCIMCINCLHANFPISFPPQWNTIMPGIELLLALRILIMLPRTFCNRNKSIPGEPIQVIFADFNPRLTPTGRFFECV